MSETPPSRPRGSRWLRLAVATAIVSGAVLLVALPLADLLVWGESPQGLGQPGFPAWVAALWLAVSPVVLALQAGRLWRRGYGARRLLIAAWVLIAMAALAQWDIGRPWPELLLRPVTLALMLVMLRPLDPVDDAGPEEEGGNDEGPTNR